MSPRLALPLIALLGALGAPSAALAEGPEELFIDAARAGRLSAGDVAALELEGPACFVGSKKGGALLCVGHARAADRSERWEILVVDATGVAFSAQVLGLTAAAAEAGDDPTDDARGLAKANKALRAVRWSDDLRWSHTYTLRDGKLEGDAKRSLTLPDGRAATLTDGGLDAADGTRLEVAPAAGLPLTRVTIYAVPGSSRLVAVVDDAAANRGDATCSTRVIVSGSAPAAPDAAPVDASCRAGVWCPPHYAALKPLLDRFCMDAFGDAEVAEVAALAERGALDAEDLAVLFNAYGALYGYSFKKKTEYNGFFYGGDAPGTDAKRPWLPPPCRTAFGKYTAQNAPSSLRKARDEVKRLWRAHK